MEYGDNKTENEVKSNLILPSTFWLTGLPCSGKTTLAKRLKEDLSEKGYHIVHLDGDIVREGLNEDLTFSASDRYENLRRVAHVAKLFNKNGLYVVSSFITPTNEARSLIKKIIGDVKMVYVQCSLDECERRDIKGMYAKARRGEIKGFTGVDDPFEEPDDAININTENYNVKESLDELVNRLGLQE